MLAFHVFVHARPAGDWPQRIVALAGGEYRALNLPPGQSAPPLDVTFDQVVAALGKLERLFCEPDGSLVWTAAGEPRWQVDGQLYDGGQRLAYVELKGACLEGDFDRFLMALGWPDAPLVFQLAREGVWLEEAEFRRFAAL